MCKQHWERVLELIQEKRFHRHVNLLEVRAYMYACYLESKITMEEWNNFEAAIDSLDPDLLLIGVPAQWIVALNSRLVS
jgi:hypothetical protein